MLLEYVYIKTKFFLLIPFRMGTPIIDNTASGVPMNSYICKFNGRSTDFPAGSNRSSMT